MKTGIELIAEERLRQVNKEGWSSGHDSRYKGSELAWAAAVYAVPSKSRMLFGRFKNGKPRLFPWAVKWWKPCPDDRVRELVKAGALIAAEIDRLQKI